MKALNQVAALAPTERYLVEYIVITDIDNKAIVSAVLPLCPLKIKLVIEPTIALNGHIQQKYSKLTSDLHTNATFLFHLDSDVFLYRWNDACFFDTSDPGALRPWNDYAPWDALPSQYRRNWKIGTEFMLQVSDVEFEFSRSNQHIYPHALYGKLRSYLEKVHGRTFHSLFADRTKALLVGTYPDLVAHQKPGRRAILISDFNTMGAFVYYISATGMISRNVKPSAQIPTLGTNCVMQCNMRLLTEECCDQYYTDITSKGIIDRWADCARSQICQKMEEPPAYLKNFDSHEICRKSLNAKYGTRAAQ
jgi:hypothetical protein